MLSTASARVIETLRSCRTKATCKELCISDAPLCHLELPPDSGAAIRHYTQRSFSLDLVRTPSLPLDVQHTHDLLSRGSCSACRCSFQTWSVSWTSLSRASRTSRAIGGMTRRMDATRPERRKGRVESERQRVDTGRKVRASKLIPISVVDGLRRKGIRGRQGRRRSVP